MIINFTPPTQKPERSLLTRLLIASGWAVLITILGAISWSLLAYFANRISLEVAFLIGLGIAIAYGAQFRPNHFIQTIVMFVPCLAATLASILLGEYIATVFMIARALHYPLWDSAIFVASGLENMLSSPDTVMGLFLGIIGSIFGYLAMIRRK